MNKTNIIEFIIDHLLFKLWNVSSKMRKRLRWMVKERIAVVPTYNEKLLQVFKWIRIKDKGSSKFKLQKYKAHKGLLNYRMFSEEDIITILKTNGEINCYDMFKPTDKPIQINYIYKLSTYDLEWVYFSNFTINKVKELSLTAISSEEIQSALLKINYIDSFSVSTGEIKYLDLSKIKIFKLTFRFVDLQGTVKLPDCLYELNLNLCKNIDYIQCSKLQKLSLDLRFDYKDTIDYKWFSHMKKLKKLKINRIKLKIVNALPSSIRCIYSIKVPNYEVKVDSLRKKFPYLKEISFQMKLNDIELCNLKGAIPIPSKTKAKYTVRPKKIRILKRYGELLKTHNELFEQVRDVVVECQNFRFDCLPSGIRYLTFKGRRFANDFIENVKANGEKFKETTLIIKEGDLDSLETILGFFKEIVVFRINVNTQSIKERRSQLKINIIK